MMNWNWQMYWTSWHLSFERKKEEAGYYSNWLFIGPFQAYWYGDLLSPIAGIRRYRWLYRLLTS